MEKKLFQQQITWDTLNAIMRFLILPHKLTAKTKEFSAHMNYQRSVAGGKVPRAYNLVLFLIFHTFLCTQRLFLQNFRTDFAVTLEQHWRTDSNVRQSEYQSHVHIHAGNTANLRRAGPSCTRLNLYRSTQSSILAFNIKHPRIQCKI